MKRKKKLYFFSCGDKSVLELLVAGSVAGTIAENLPGTQTSYQWSVGQISSSWVNPGADFKVRVTSVVPPVTETIYYFYDNGGKLLSEYDQTGVCVKDYLYLGGKMIGEYQPATTTYYYYASDQINSTRVVTDATGAVVRSAQYDPYGGLYKTWVDTYHPKPGFSGKEREAGTEMDYFGARYYGHKHYRFNSVDPVRNKEEAITNPQFWNLYTYCRNNSICYLDPDGNKVISYSEALGGKFLFIKPLVTLRHSWLEITTQSKKYSIELSGMGKVVHKEITLDANFGSRPGQLKNTVNRPTANPEGDYTFENKIINIAKYFETNPEKLPKYNAFGPNCNGFIRFLIEAAEGGIEFNYSPFYDEFGVDIGSRDVYADEKSSEFWKNYHTSSNSNEG